MESLKKQFEQAAVEFAQKSHQIWDKVVEGDKVKEFFDSLDPQLRNVWDAISDLEI